MANNSKKYILENRKYVFWGVILLITFVFIIRLFYLQIINSDYKAWADSNAFFKKTLNPARGAIYDRNGELLVFNQLNYEVMMITREIQPFDTTDFCNTLGITKERFLKRMEDVKNRRLNPGYSSYTPQMFMNHLSTDDYGVLQEKLYKFPGFYVQSRTIREYTYPHAALILGNIGEVNRKDLENDSYYVQGDYSGRAGVERSYESHLRGVKGVEILLRDAHGRIKGGYEEGMHDVAPIPGRDLTLSIDIELQKYGEELMKNMRGSIVMIEPSTGEVLCMVSSPSYDPSLLVGKERGNNYMKLEYDSKRPLFDRSIMSFHSPGSTFKIAQALVFLEEDVILPSTAYSCHGGYPLGRGKPACHPHYSPAALVPAIATSCNSYFCWGLHDMLDSRKRYPTIQEGLDVWRKHIVSMGFGSQLGIDLPSEKRGYIPTSKRYDTLYKGRWNSQTIISIAIGQGEITTTPLQLCNLAATMANRGYFFTPHVVKAVQDTVLDAKYLEKRIPTISAKHYQPVAEGMRQAVVSGTCWRAAIPGIDVAGKTGTVQNPHGENHSAFMGFAPYDKPQVAITVFVENVGYGGTYAVPIGRLMMEKYLNGELSEESILVEEQMKYLLQ